MVVARNPEISTNAMKWTCGEEERERPWSYMYAAFHPCSGLGPIGGLGAQRDIFLMSFLPYLMGPKISSIGPASTNVLPSYPEILRLLAISAPAATVLSSPHPTWLAPWPLH